MQMRSLARVAEANQLLGMGWDSSDPRTAAAGSLSGPSSSHRSTADGDQVQLADTSRFSSGGGTGKDTNAGACNLSFANGR